MSIQQSAAGTAEGAAAQSCRGNRRRLALEPRADEPDATDRWKPKHRKQVLDYLHTRDGERCGLCGGKMKLKGAQVEHVVPKRFAVFELTADGEARQGTYYTSVLHGMENLQAAHPRCNKYKGNTPDIRRWRHPSMPRLVVAKANEDRVLMLPPADSL